MEDIVRWTVGRFGRRQARIYARTLASAIEALTRGPSVPGATARDEIGPGLFSLHVARQGRRGRHFILFRVQGENPSVIDVLRLLHDAMDLARHVPTEGEEE
jgi:toxin ParE1/3/4